MATQRSGRTQLIRPVDQLDPNTLRPYPGNARTHSARQIEQLTSSISCFGFVVPAVINGDREIIAGHARVEAAKRLGLDRIPCLRLEHLSQAQQRAYRLADNRLAELAAWDTDLLSKELQALAAVDLDFSLEITGFDAAEIDFIIEGNKRTSSLGAADDVRPPGVGQPTISRIGDLWLLDEHRLLCGDALHRASFKRLLGGDKAQMVFADPPYGVPIGGVGRHDLAMEDGQKDPREHERFLSAICAGLVEFSIDGAIHFICGGWRHAKTLLTAAGSIYSELKDICVWTRDEAGGKGSFYRSKHEFVFVWKAGTAAHITANRGGSGRRRGNVWDYAGVNSVRTGRDDAPAMPPTVKPVALVADAIKDFSKRGGIVLDPFVGSGTTLIAAEKTSRRAAAIELDPLYVDTAIRRWQSYTGKSAVHSDTGASFAERELQQAEYAGPPPLETDSSA